MSAFFYLIPVSLLFVGIGFAVLMWCFRSKQFEDLDKHSTKILHDDD